MNGSSSLQGDLHEFPLTDIIQLVDLSQKTGGVHITGQRGSQHLDGWIYFRDGKIVAAELPGMAPLDAVYAFFTLTAGPFRLYDGKEPPDVTITASNELIIMEGIAYQEAWVAQHPEGEGEADALPPLTMVPRLIPNPSSGTTEINLEAEEWRVLTMVNGKNSVQEIAQRSNLGAERAREIIAQLLTSGLIEERSLHSEGRVIPELERIMGAVVGGNAAALVRDACTLANVNDPATADLAQMNRVVQHLEQSISALVGADRARRMAREMRQRAEELLS